MTTTTVFVAEKISDATLLRSLLSISIPKLDMEFYAAQGKLGLASLAGNIAVDLRCAMMIIGDSDRLAPDEAELFEGQHRVLIEHLLPSELVGVFLFTPSLEQVISDTLEIDVKDAITADRLSMIEAALLESNEVELTAHPQLAAFLRAVLKLRAAMTLPMAEAEQPTTYEHAM